MTYDIPTLNTTGAQPATDIVDALTDIKTEANGSVETGNLADGGIGPANWGNTVFASWRGDRLRRYALTTPLTLSGVNQQIIPTISSLNDGLYSVFVRCVISGTGSFQVTWGDVTSVLRTTLFSGSGATTIASTPGSTVGGAVGAPMLYVPTGSGSLYFYGSTGFGTPPTVESFEVYIKNYGGFS